MTPSLTKLIFAILLLGSYSLCSAEIYSIKPGQEVIGTVQSIIARSDDTLIEIAHEFNLGYEEVVAANPHLDPWLPIEGGKVILPRRFILPAEREKTLHINLAEYRIYYFFEKDKVMTFPISIGRGEWQTPHNEKGQVIIEDKIINPNWYPPESIREEHSLRGDPLPMVVLPGPDNPLGKYAMKLSIPGYFIHGTNRPYGIGMKATHGCIRLRPHDIKLLFDQAPRQTKIKIYSQPFKVGVWNKTVYFEASSSEQKRLSDEEYQNAMTLAFIKVIDNSVELDKSLKWQKIFDIAKKRNGIPSAVNFDHKAPTIKSVARISTFSVIPVQKDNLF